jgi:uncharacterized protein
MPVPHGCSTPPAELVPPEVVAEVARLVHGFCLRHARRLPFHGWHHVRFVRDKAVGFARANGADPGLVAVAALVHDVNYVVRRASAASAGRDVRLALLAEAGVRPAVARRVDAIVDEAEMATRGRHISAEAQALSDADTLFKALPVTPVVLAHRYLAENGIGLGELAAKIVGEQRGVHEAGYYFYSPAAAAQYERWAGANLELWQCVAESLTDPAVTELLAEVERLPEERAG